MVPGGRNRSPFRRLNFAGDRIAGGVDVHLHGALEQPTDRLQHAAGQIGEVLLFSHLPERGEPDRQADQPVRVAGEVFGQLVVRPEPRDEHVEAQSPQDVRPGEEVRVIDVGFRGEAVQSHLSEDHGLLPAHARLLEELFSRPLEQVERELGGRPEAAPLHQDRLLVK